MVSLTTTFTDGSQVEVGMFGYESVIGISALMGTRQSLNRIYAQIAGFGYTCTVDAAKREFQLGGVFQSLTLRYVQAQLVQAMQSAGCNAKHEIHQRLARWLLLCADRAHSTTFSISHEYLADMLGASRPTVTVAAGNLKRKGLIEYTRGTIHIPDPKRLMRDSDKQRVAKVSKSGALGQRTNTGRKAGGMRDMDSWNLCRACARRAGSVMLPVS